MALLVLVATIDAVPLVFALAVPLEAVQLVPEVPFDHDAVDALYFPERVIRYKLIQTLRVKRSDFAIIL